MIEVSIKEVDRVRFISKVKIVSWEKHFGLPVQEVNYKLLYYPLMKDVLSSLMLEKVGYDSTRAIVYFAQRPVNDLVYRFVKTCYRAYWRTISLLYDHARVFKAIPPGVSFSWRYFTPYTWYKGTVAKLLKLKNS